MSRLPIVGGDDDIWGQVLNDFLSVSLNADGTLKDVTSLNGIAAGGVTGQMLVKSSDNDYDTTWISPVNWISVKSYGAVGDGVTDDTFAIQSALGTAYGGSTVVYFPAGTYLISSSLEIGGGMHSINLIGDGPNESIIRQDPSNWSDTQMLDISISNVSVRNLQFMAASDIVSDNPAADCIRLFGPILNITIDNCWGNFGNGWFITTALSRGSGPTALTLSNLTSYGTQGINIVGIGDFTSGSNTNLVNITVTALNGEALLLDGVFDVNCVNFEGLSLAGPGVIHIRGTAGNIYFFGANVGGLSGNVFTGPGCLIESSGGQRPQNVNFVGGRVLAYDIGFIIDCDDFLLSNYTITKSGFDGIDIVGSGTNIVIQNTRIKQSGRSTGGSHYYDINVTNTTGAIYLNQCFGETIAVLANLNSTSNTVATMCTWLASPQVTGTLGPSIATPGNILYNSSSGNGHYFQVGGTTLGSVDANGRINATNQIYPGSEGSGYQTSGGVIHAVGVPNDANGNNNDWCISDNGHMYFKAGGTWTQKI